ncbi:MULTISPECIES: DNA-methyltransferase [Lactobacillaceae]|uniref:DNA-methyltransferase n=1 Tax=Lactobacillaceae TaxID=33958 RepID=UPI000FF8D44F|nr:MULTISPECIES: site-specific DNA-methyltransferase [Lactiplantibacillus]QAR77499.1 site-specific DNA-methyltransferase [Lactiplantibacillus plantarum]USJ87982.1 site-specific DNA-methyltransferase [Lactiplantibacillus pentosus]
MQEPLQLDLTFGNESNHSSSLPEENKEEPLLQFKSNHGKLFLGDATKFLQTLPDKSVDLIIADPPYSIKKAEWDTFKSQNDYVEWSLLWIREASRVLKNTGSLYIAGFSEIIADIKYRVSQEELFEGARWLIWHYLNKANLGKDWGRSHETFIQFRKSKKFTMNQDFIRIPYGQHTLRYPSHPQSQNSEFSSKKKRDAWQPNPLGAKPKDVIEIPILNNGSPEKTPHPTQKPEELIRKFVLSSSNRNELVVDPFSGSGTTVTVAEELGRKWIGNDMIKKYNDMAIQRITSAKHMSDEEWFWFDRENELRRKGIR